MKLEFGVGLGRNERMSEVAEISQVAEECGFAHATFVDQPYMSPDPMVCMTIAAMNTRRIRIGQGVTDPETTNALVLGNAAATMTELTGGRYFLGIGAGGLFGKVMKPVGARRLREAIEFIRDFTAGKEVEWNGATIQHETSRRQVPVYIAGAGRRSLELAGRIGDGAIIMGGPPEFVKLKVDTIRQAAEKAGRDPDKIEIVCRTWIYPCESKEQAAKEVAGCLTQHCGLPSLDLDNPDPEISRLLRDLEDREPGILAEIRKARDLWEPKYHEHPQGPHALVTTPRMIDLVHLTGREEDIIEGLEKLYEAGVRTVAPGSYTIIDKKGLLREISAKIMPHFRN